MADLELARRHVHETRGPVLMNARIGTSDVPRVLPGRDGHANRLRFMQALGA